MIAAELAKIGIKMSLNELSFSRWITYYDGPKTYGNLFVNDNEIFADPSAMITSPEFNTSGWSIVYNFSQSFELYVTRTAAS
ncbi:MAG TPA: hypothetical protein VF070_07555 [Streptosporangiaceae bacterium]